MAQAGTPAGRKLAGLAAQLDASTPILQLRANLDALAPERLLVFELTGGVTQFTEAVRLVPGLEFLGAEDLDEDEFDNNPVAYLMVPSEAALRNIVTLWRGWQKDGNVPPRFSTWKAMLSQLRDIRSWGPQDRVTTSDHDVLVEEYARNAARIRVEIELVFRRDGDTTEAEARAGILAVGGVVVSRSRITGAGYHALLADLPGPALADIIARNPAGLAGLEAVLQIRPQSVFQLVPSEEIGEIPAGGAPALEGDPIAAIFDAVPLSQHPRLAGTLSVEDPFDLEGLAVGMRSHGTAMASAVIHGDINAPWSRPLERRVHFVNMLYAPAEPDQHERFPDLLPADMFERAILAMRTGDAPTAQHVLIVNASLGDPNKPFAGRLSGWARVVDHLAATYGILFVISAGNHLAPLETENMTASAFEALDPANRARVALRASAQQLATRRLLAPAESMNAITVGALHADQFTYPNALPAYNFDVWTNTGLCSVSSALGPGHNGATKPEILAPGGRHHVRLSPQGAKLQLRPLRENAATFGGIAVAAPPSATSLGPNIVARSIGTSVAAALATGVAARAHEALEAAYPDFGALPAAQRACLLKALLVHGSRWTDARDLLIEVLGPPEGKFHVRQKDNVRRYIGYGAFDPDRIISCADDRATLWAVGTLAADQGKRFSIPWPAAMNAKAQPHGLSATLAWFSPPRPGAVAYRAVRMKIVEPTELGTAGIKASAFQPDPNQAHKGTVVHRRWEGDRAAAIAANGLFKLDVQREADDGDTPANFAIVVTLEMPGEIQVYPGTQSHRAQAAGAGRHLNSSSTLHRSTSKSSE
ncbi:S8 family serine peptidase [Rhodobacter capsulatus]|uniref:S8 family serine peptidase n=1 Tax=Rhodobacter capsulatus TaxID=1061 RepID=UPI0040252904